MGSSVKTELVLLSFLQHGTYVDRDFCTELDSLKSELKTRDPYFRGFSLADGELQTDGNQFGRILPQSGDFADDSAEDICRVIGNQLAEIGDQLDFMIKQEVIDRLVQQMLDDKLTEKDLSVVVDDLLASGLPGMEQEKAMLLLTMLLAKKVASRVPGLLHKVFWTTVRFLNQNLLPYITDLARQNNI
ncbi:BH3-interacting domain death agonist [Microcaecilia unicolor]|uniref:BH3-interacting domain death agonist n=1 Tax=Microcaecilia unicolor TaxID=1415580 RepID=A0A6P7Z1I8_9AMPH|nr:BH3-interacting domain death agonist [Microcaecilia unicolor]XP_030071112.1 BH3-interacting domain death agonist [Microcaecilia unicolor]XP_030071113.1 BH3-interacting domain death agonist [Microcaecilia unicolor]